MGNGTGFTHSFQSLLGSLRHSLRAIWKYIYVYKLLSGRGAPEGVGMRLFTLGEEEIQCFLRILDIKTQYKLSQMNLVSN